ncbi:MAG: aminotransferase class IV [bacterium]|nr:aminotransferase class IV [bacterium]
MLVWLNGRWLAARDARVSALDRGLLHGDGLYDTWRTYGGVPFAVDAHVRRLAAACRILRLPPPGDAATWARRAADLVRRNRMADGTVRLTITRGLAGDGPLPARTPVRPTLLLTARALPLDLAAQQTRGIAAVLLPFPRDVGPWWAGVKLIGHASAVVGKMYARARRAAEGLYVTPEGEVTEATTANLFLVERGMLVTPPTGGGVLGGVTRGLVLRAARRARLAVREEPIPVARLRRAAEVFVTASTIEILPVVRLEGDAVGGGEPGPVTRRLQASYAALVAASLRRAH